MLWALEVIPIDMLAIKFNFFPHLKLTYAYYKVL